MGDHERRKAEIGLSLAAAGWEEQQASDGEVGGAGRANHAKIV
jgi:hypothetical protein